MGMCDYCSRHSAGHEIIDDDADNGMAMVCACCHPDPDLMMDSYRESYKECVETLKREVEIAKAGWDRLQLIVEKLPKTKDGVRVAPPAKLWHPGDGQVIEAHLRDVMVCGDTTIWMCYGRRPNGSAFDTSACLCYSTREAAEAAAKAKDHQPSSGIPVFDRAAFYKSLVESNPTPEDLKAMLTAIHAARCKGDAS